MQTTLKRETVKSAAERLDIDPETLRRSIRKGEISATTKTGETGVGKTKYLDPLEVDAFIRGGIPAARAYRAERDKAKIPTRKGRAGK